MDSPGEILREARRRCGLSPEEIFRLTRVRPALLEAAEGDVLSSLPEDPYTRSLYATLARVTGADLPAVLASYDRLRAARDAVVVDPGAVLPAPRRERPLGLFLGLGALAGLLLSLWLFGHVEKGPASGGSSAHRAEETEDAGASVVGGGDAGGAATDAAPPGDLPESASEFATESAATSPAMPPGTGGAVVVGGLAPVRPHVVPPPRPGDPGTGSVPDWPMLPLESDPPAPASAGGVTLSGEPPPIELVLEVEALGDSWIRVVTDGSRARSGILPLGERRVWRGMQEIRLDIADASRVRLMLNGRPVELATGGTPVQHLSFTPDLVGQGSAPVP